MKTLNKLPTLARDARLNWLLWFLVIVLPGGSVIPVVSVLLAKHQAHHAAQLPAGEVK